MQGTPSRRKISEPLVEAHAFHRFAKGNRSFTLIEMLVVVAILSILIALFFPVIGRMREAQRGIVCLSNLRQIGVGMSLYMAENDGWTPKPADEVNYTDWWGSTWKGTIASYIGDSSVFICPAHPENIYNHAARPPGWSGTYGINAYLGNPTEWDVRQSRTISHPSETIMVGENGDGDWVCEPIGGPWTPPGTQVAIHSGKGNFLFVDGHVEALTVKESNRDNFYLWRVEK